MISVNWMMRGDLVTSGAEIGEETFSLKFQYDMGDLAKGPPLLGRMSRGNPM